jgi:nickel transport protein
MRAPVAVAVLAAMLLWPVAADAHRLKLFATVEDGTVSGYAFFIGGGRPEGAALVIRDGEGRELYRGTTDAAGTFSWRPPQASDLTLLVDAGDGHVAEAAITEGRFSVVEGSATAAAAADSAGAESGVLPADAKDLADMIGRSVDRAVSRQVRPLLEAYAAAEGRVRFNDVAGGIGMIIGLAGVALWALGRRRGDRT